MLEKPDVGPRQIVAAAQFVSFAGIGRERCARRHHHDIANDVVGVIGDIDFRDVFRVSVLQIGTQAMQVGRPVRRGIAAHQLQQLTAPENALADQPRDHFAPAAAAGADYRNIHALYR